MVHLFLHHSLSLPPSSALVDAASQGQCVATQNGARVCHDRNQLLVEGISPMVSLRFVNATDSQGQTTALAIYDTTGPLSTKAASWEPLFLQPEDPGCSLGRAAAQYRAAHPTGPELLMGTSVLTGVVNNEVGAWQVGVLRVEAI